LAEYDRPDLTAFHLRRSLELEPKQPDAEELKKLLQSAEEELARREKHSPTPAAGGDSENESGSAP
jgi:hypothetical protein